VYQSRLTLIWEINARKASFRSDEFEHEHRDLNINAHRIAHSSIHAELGWRVWFFNPPEALFGRCRIHFNPCVLVWIGVEFSSSSIPIHLNTYGLM